MADDWITEKNLKHKTSGTTLIYQQRIHDFREQARILINDAEEIKGEPAFVRDYWNRRVRDLSRGKAPQSILFTEATK